MRPFADALGADADPDLVALLAHVAGADLPPDAAGFVGGLEPPVLLGRARQAVVTYLTAEAARRPVLLGFEDLHWSDDLTIDLIGDLLAATETHPIGVALAMRPYRDDPSCGGYCFYSNSYIRTGIDLNDRAEFYVPWVMNPDNPNQLFLGTYRLYRTDNAKASAAAAVTWKPISGDLTYGCTGSAPNGGRGCTISAVGVGGGQAVYTGSEMGYVYVSPDAQTSDNPTWTRVGKSLPGRPVSSIAVDRSNYRIAYVAFDGFNAGTRGHPGHVFKTTDGGRKWTDISGNLPDAPVDSVVLDPSYPNTLYVGTDVGTFVTYDGGTTWGQLGTDLPDVTVAQLSLDPSQPGVRTLAAGTYGRSAWELNDNRSVPAFDVSTVDNGKPVGPGSTIDYTLTLKNIGNQDATGVTITDPIPANTGSATAQDGGTVSGGKVTWSGLSVSAGGSVQVHFSVTVDNSLKKQVTAIVNDGVIVTSNEGVGTTGSPFVSPLAPEYALTVAPAAQTGGAKTGTDVTYHVTITNRGYMDDTYNVSASGATFSTSVYASDCTTSLTTTSTVPAGSSTDVCVKVQVPAGNGRMRQPTPHGHGHLHRRTARSRRAGRPRRSRSASTRCSSTRTATGRTCSRTTRMRSMRTVSSTRYGIWPLTPACRSAT